MVAATFPAVAEAAKDCRGGWFWICVGMEHCDLDGVIGRTVYESHWTDDRSRQKETDENAA